MDDPQWLADELDRAVREGWCMRRGCTTCGSFQMLNLLSGNNAPGRHAALSAYESMSADRAEFILAGMHACSRPSHREGLMWLIYMIWFRFREAAHTQLFPSLAGSFAGDVLNEMRSHFASVQEKRRLHYLRQGLKKKDWPE